METTVFLVRHGVTAWHAEKKLLGQRDIPLNDDGVVQGNHAAEMLSELSLSEVLSSPLQRSVQTAKIIGESCGIEVGRDPRLTEFDVGGWAGMRVADIAETPEYKAFLENPTAERIPGGENLAEVRERAVAAIEQALEDNPSGDAIAVVTHAGIIRVLLAHYLGSPPANYHRISVSPGSVSVLSFADGRELPRILAVNFVSQLSSVLEGRSAQT